MNQVEEYSFSKLYIWGASRSQFWNLIVRAIALANSFFILAVLSVYQYGLYQLVLAAIAIASSFTAGLFDDVVVNDISRALAEKRTAFAKRLFNEFFAAKTILGVLIFAALFLVADVVARYYGKDIAGYVRILSAIIALDALRLVEISFFRARLSFTAFGSGAVQELARLATLAAFWVGGVIGLREVLLANIFAAVVVLAYLSFFFAREYFQTFRSVVGEKGWLLWKAVRRYGRWIFLRYGFSRALKGSDVWLIRFFLNTEAVAIYSLVANLLALIQNLFPTAMLSTLLPWEVHRPGRLQHIYRRMVKYGFWSGLAVGAAAFFAVPFAVGIFFPKYLPAMPLFRAMLASLPLYVIYKSQKIFLIVLREQKILTMRLISEALLTAAIFVIFLPLIGLFAAIIVNIVAYGGRVALYLIHLQRHPHNLSVKPRDVFSFDRDDRAFVIGVVREILTPSHWLRPIKVRT